MGKRGAYKLCQIKMRRDTFSMSGDDLQVSGLSVPSSGDEVIGCSIHAAGRYFPSIRYFSDVCPAAID
jgi:hypothetical protein